MEGSSRRSELFKSSSDYSNKKNSQWWEHLDYTSAPHESLFESTRSPLLKDNELSKNRQLDPEYIKILQAEASLPDFRLQDYEQELKRKRKTSHSINNLSNNTSPDKTENLVFKRPLFNRQRNAKRFSSFFDGNEKSSNSHKIDKAPSTYENNEKNLFDDLDMNVGRKNLFNRKPVQKKRNFSDAFEFEEEEFIPQEDQIEIVQNTSTQNVLRKSLLKRKALSAGPLISPTVKQYSHQTITEKNEQVNNKSREFHVKPPEENHNSKHSDSSSDTIKSFDNLLSSTKIHGNVNSPGVHKRMSLYNRRTSNEDNYDIVRNVTNFVSQPPTLTNLKVTNIKSTADTEFETAQLSNTPKQINNSSRSQTSQKSRSVYSEKLSKILTKPIEIVDEILEKEYETFSDINDTIEVSKNKNIFQRNKNESNIEKRISQDNFKNLSNKKNQNLSKNLSNRKSKSITKPIESINENEVSDDQKKIIKKSNSSKTMTESDNVPELKELTNDSYYLKSNDTSKMDNYQQSQRYSKRKSNQLDKIDENSSQSRRVDYTDTKTDDLRSVRHSKIKESENIEYRKSGKKITQIESEDPQSPRLNSSRNSNFSRKNVENNEQNSPRRSQFENRRTNMQRSRRDLSQSPNKSKINKREEDTPRKSQVNRRTNEEFQRNKSIPRKSQFEKTVEEFQNETESEGTDNPNHGVSSSNEQYLSQPESIQPQFTKLDDSRSQTLLSDLSKKYLDEARTREIKHRKILNPPESESDAEIRKSQFLNSKNQEDNRSIITENFLGFEPEIKRSQFMNIYKTKNEDRLQQIHSESESEFEIEIRKSELNTSKNRNKNKSKLRTSDIENNETKNKSRISQYFPESELEIETRSSQSNVLRDQIKNRSKLQQIASESEMKDVRTSNISSTSRTQNKNRSTLQPIFVESESEPEIRRSQFLNASRNREETRTRLTHKIPESVAEMRKSQYLNFSQKENENRSKLQQISSESEIIDVRTSNVSSTSRTQNKNRSTLQPIFVEPESEPEIRRSPFLNASRNREETRSRLTQKISESETEIRKSQHLNFSQKENENRSKLQQNFQEFEYTTDVGTFHSNASRSHNINKSKLRLSEHENYAIKNNSRLQKNFPESESEVDIRSQSSITKNRNENRSLRDSKFVTHRTKNISGLQKKISESESDLEIRTSQMNVTRDQNRKRSGLQQIPPESEFDTELRRSQLNISKNYNKNRSKLNDSGYTNISRNQENMSRLTQNFPESETEIKQSQYLNKFRSQNDNRSRLKQILSESESDVEIRTSKLNVSRERNEKRSGLQQNLPEMESETEIRSQLNTSRNYNKNRSKLRDSEYTNTSRNQKNRSRLTQNFPESKMEIRRSEFLNSFESQNNSRSRLQQIPSEHESDVEIQTSQFNTSRDQKENKLRDSEFDKPGIKKRFKSQQNFPESESSVEIRTSQFNHSKNHNENRSNLREMEFDNLGYKNISRSQQNLSDSESEVEIRRSQLNVSKDRNENKSRGQQILPISQTKEDNRRYEISVTSRIHNKNRSTLKRIIVESESEIEDEIRRSQPSKFSKIPSHSEFNINTEPNKNKLSGRITNKMDYTPEIETGQDIVDRIENSRRSNDSDTGNIRSSQNSRNSVYSINEYGRKIQITTDDYDSHISQRNVGISNINRYIELYETPEKTYKENQIVRNTANKSLKKNRNTASLVTSTLLKESAKKLDKHERQEMVRNDELISTNDIFDEILQEQKTDRNEELLQKRKTDINEELLQKRKTDRNEELVQKRKTDRNEELLQEQETDRNEKLLQKRKPDRIEELLEEWDTDRNEELLQKRKTNKHEELLQEQKTDRNEEIVQKRKTDINEELLQERKTDRNEDLLQKRKTDINEELLQERKTDRNEDLLQKRKTDRNEELVQKRKTDRNEELLQERKTDRNEDLLQKRKTDKNEELVQKRKTDRNGELLQEQETDRTAELVQKRKTNRNEELLQEQETDRLEKLFQKPKSDRNDELLQKQKTDRNEELLQNQNTHSPEEIVGTIEHIVDIIENYKGPIPKRKLQMRKCDELFERMRELQKNKKIEKPKPKIKKPLPPWRCMANGEPIPKPVLYKSKKWMTKIFYRHLEKCLEPKFGIDNTLKAEIVMKKLGEISDIVMKSKRYEGTCIEDLKKLLAEYGIVKTTYEFYLFVMDWLPFDLQQRIVPVSLPTSHVAKIIVPKIAISALENILK